MNRARLEEIRRVYCPNMSEKANIIYHPEIAALLEYIGELEKVLLENEYIDLHEHAYKGERCIICFAKSGEPHEPECIFTKIKDK